MGRLAAGSKSDNLRLRKESLCGWKLIDGVLGKDFFNMLLKPLNGIKIGTCIYLSGTKQRFFHHQLDGFRISGACFRQSWKEKASWQCKGLLPLLF